MSEPALANCLTNLTNLMRVYLARNEEVEKLIKPSQELFRWLKKDTKGAGKSWEYPVIYKGPNAIAPTRAQVQAIGKLSAGTTLSETWKGEWAPLKASIYAEHEALLIASRGTESTRAYFNVQVESLQMELAKFGDYTEEQVWGSAGKSVAYGAFSAGTITFTDKSIASNFKPGDVLQASANDGSSTGHSVFGGLGYVVATNPNAGTIDVSASDKGTKGVPLGWTGSVYLFRYGAFGGGATPERLIYGLQQWLPAADPSTSFLNVDRTKDIVAFSGVRLSSADTAGLNLLVIVQRLCVAFKNRGYDLHGEKALWVHPEIWLQIATLIENQGIRLVQESEATTGLQSFKISTVLGTISVIPATHCPYNQIYLLDKNALVFQSLGNWPMEMEVAGEKVRSIVQQDSDYYEWRWMGLGNLIVKAPGACAVAYVAGSPSF